jgi:ubiquinone/menaquinone biosynthesis C-methylase UbiE
MAATDTLQDRRRAIREIADAIAPTWARRRAEVERTSTPVREWLVRELAPQEGDTVLDLAAGVGETGFDAAGHVGPTGRLITTDLSPRMLEAARRRGAERAIGNVEYRVMDAERIELPDDSVDRVVCRFGYMLMADPAAALAETGRVLRPGGRVTLAVWGPPERNPYFTAPAMSLVRRGHVPPPEPPPAPGPFALAAPGRLDALLHGAGFADVRVEDVPVRFSHRDLDEYLDVTADTAGPVGLALQRLTAEERAAVKADVTPALAGFAVHDGFEIPGLALCAVAAMSSDALTMAFIDETPD